MAKRSVSGQLSEDESRFDLIERLARQQEAEEQGEELPPEPTPHAQGLAARRLLVTFPDPAWPEAIRALADDWHCRHSDLIVRAVSVYVDLVEQGKASPPDPVGDGRLRAGEGQDLPWDPTAGETP
jgi:hypothetical protein